MSAVRTFEITETSLGTAMEDLERRVRAGAGERLLNLEMLYPHVWDDSESALELAYAEYAFRRARGEKPEQDAWRQAYPHWADRLERLFGLYDLMSDHNTGDGRDDRTSPERDESAKPIVTNPPGYHIHDELGRGGMAIVYRATQIALNRPVALKVLRGTSEVGEADFARLRREAEVMARLGHPHILPIYESGEWDGVPYLALEYVPGGTLAEELSRRTAPLTPHQSAVFVETIAQAMHAAHGEGVIHRDLKPANVLLAGPAEDRLALPKIADFGLALDVTPNALVSQSLTLSGTPGYMAPEQVEASRDAIGFRTDIYALGGLLYELLTGRPPHRGPTVLETLDLVRHADPTRPRSIRAEIPSDLETICLKALAKDPARRYDSARSLADDLRRYLDGKPIVARPVRAPERAWKWVRRHPVVSGLAAALLLATGISAGFYDAKAREGKKVAFVERENARLEDIAMVDKVFEASRQLLKSGFVSEARTELESLPVPLRTDAWRDLAYAASALRATFDYPLFVNSRIPSHSASEDGRHLLLLPSQMSGTASRVVDITTGRVVAQHKLEAYIHHGSMGRGRSVILIPSFSTRSTYQTRMKKKPEMIVKYWDLAANAPNATVPLDAIEPVASENGLFVLQAANDGRVDVFDIANAVPLMTWSLGRATIPGQLQWAVSNGGQYVLSRERKGWLVYPTADPTNSFPIPANAAYRSFVGFSSDDRYVYWLEASGSPTSIPSENPNDLVQWDLKNRTERLRIRLGPRPPSLVMSPDGEWIAVTGSQSVTVYRTRTGELAFTLYGREFPTFNLCFSRNSRHLYSMSAIKLKVWDVSVWTKPTTRDSEKSP